MKAIPIELDDGQRVLIEADDTPVVISGQPVSWEATAPTRVKETVASMADMAGAIVGCCRELRERTQAAWEAAPPSEFTIAFGLKFSAEAGVWLLSKVAGEASISVTASWKK